jgi:hypothetical protein
MPPTNDQTADRAEPTSADTPPCWEWDLWEADMLKRGMSKDLAGLGRAVIREAMGGERKGVRPNYLTFAS